MTIAATNTAEGVQTVRAASTYTPTAGLGPVVLPETTWTPTGAGPIRFTLAAPGSAVGGGRHAALRQRLPLARHRGRSRDARLRAGGDRDRQRRDPVVRRGPQRLRGPLRDRGQPGPPGVRERGQQPAAAGRGRRRPPRRRRASPQPTASPGPPAATPVPTATPTPVAKAPAGRIVSSRLTASRGGRIELRLACPQGSSTCRGTIGVKSAAKIKLGKRSKIVTLTRPARYTLAPGKQRIVTLSLSKDGRAAFKRTRSIAARVQLKTSAGVTATRRITVTQRRGS